MAAGVFPHPPALVPEVTGQRSGELDALRASCERAVEHVFRHDPDLVAVVGGDDRTASYRPPVAGTLRPYGIDLTFGDGKPELPLSLTIGRWLLGDHADQVPLQYESLAWELPTRDCAALGREIADRVPRTALIAVGDGSACRDEEAAGYYHPDAQQEDDRTAAALDTGDPAELLALEPETAARLLIAGRPAWQVLAGASGGGPREAQLLDYQAPYGVGYFVASWR